MVRKSDRLTTRRTVLVAAGAAVALKRWRGTETIEAKENVPKEVKIVQFSDTGQRKDTETLPVVVKTETEWKQQLPPASFEVTRHAAIEPLLLDDDVTEIMGNPNSSWWFERGGKLYQEKTISFDAARLLTGLEVIANQLGKRLDEDSPSLHAQLPDGSRIAAWIPPLVNPAPAPAIRNVWSAAVLQAKNESGLLVCTNVSGLCWSKNSWPEWNALRPRPI